jgi:hypothetical protein
MKTILATILVVLFYSSSFAAGNCLNYLTQETWGTCVFYEDCNVGDDGPVWWIWCENMPDVDDDGVPDAYDNDTLWGFISGINKVGVPITIAIVIDVVGTDEDGYYAFGPLEEGDHVIVPEPTDNNTWFAPRFEIMAP